MRLRLVLPAALAALALAMAAVAPPAEAQRVDLAPDRFSFDPDLPYAEDVPRPADVIGHEIGTAFTLYAHVVDYLQAVAEASDRVTIHRYGTSHEGRPLYYLAVTSAGSQGRIGAIKQASRRLARPDRLGEDERRRLLEEQPVVVSYSYNIHGDEASATEAALRVLYRLAAATDAETRRLLSESVVLLWPTVNPDGRDRYVYGYRTMRSSQVAVDPNDLAHDQNWPSGRVNHYWFDLNRDWVWTTQPEMRGLVDAYQEWMPQVHADYHEQGYDDNYFTMPGTTPRNPLLPDGYTALADTFGRANIEAFDQEQVAYFTREAFDFFYPGYGSSYPSTMGAIGMLTEQAGIDAGRAVRNEDGYVLTLRQRVFDHYMTTIATLRAAVRNRQRLIEYFVDAHSQRTNTVETAAYVFPDDGGRGYLYDVIEMLRRHGVTVERTTEPMEVSGALDYRSGERAERRFGAGTYVVPADQSRHLFVNTILQRRVTFRDSVMYDMSTWSAPLAYNLEAYSTREAPEAAAEPVEEAPTPPSGVANADARYAYVVDWNQRHAPSALARLWEAGYRVRAAHEPFDTGARRFSAGSLIVLLGRNYEKDDPAADMRRIARTAGVRIHGLDTGRMQSGPDLGSQEHGVLNEPTVAMMTKGPFSPYTSGQIWHLFDQGTEMPITRLDASSFSGAPSGGYGDYGAADLESYDVLILPGAYGLSGVLDSTRQAALKDWVRGGGTLVATESSALFLTEGRSGFTGVEASTDTSGAIGPTTPYRARGDSAALDGIPGAALDGRLDATHPLTYGIGERVYPLVYGTSALAPSPDLQSAGTYADEPPSSLLVSGYASQENLRRLAGTTFAGTVTMGEGQVVLLPENPHFRMFWRGPSRMMQNAAMLVPALVD